MANSNKTATNKATNQNNETGNFPKFFVIETKDNNAKKIAELSPFVIEKVLQGSIGETKSVKKMRQGGLLVKVSRKTQADKILKMSKFFESEVTVTKHRSLNSSRGVVVHPDLRTSDTAEIMDGLARFGVTEAQHITKMQDGKRVATGAVILTFDSNQLPQEVKAGFLNLKVRLYIPNPMRCFKCQAFGHTSSRCRNAEVCARCSEPAHTDAYKQIKCANCGKDHPAYVASCEKFLLEKEICKVKTERNISYPEARKLVLEQSLTTTYANVTRTTSKIKQTSIQTQTDYVHCTCCACRMQAGINSNAVVGYPDPTTWTAPAGPAAPEGKVSEGSGSAMASAEMPGIKSPRSSSAPSVVAATAAVEQQQGSGSATPVVGQISGSRPPGGHQSRRSWSKVGEKGVEKVGKVAGTETRASSSSPQKKKQQLI